MLRGPMCTPRTVGHSPGSHTDNLSLSIILNNFSSCSEENQLNPICVGAWSNRLVFHSESIERLGLSMWDPRVGPTWWCTPVSACSWVPILNHNQCISTLLQTRKSGKFGFLLYYKAFRRLVKYSFSNSIHLILCIADQTPLHLKCWMPFQQ